MAHGTRGTKGGTKRWYRGCYGNTYTYTHYYLYIITFFKFIFVYLHVIIDVSILCN